MRRLLVVATVALGCVFVTPGAALACPQPTPGPAKAMPAANVAFTGTITEVGRGAVSMRYVVTVSRVFKGTVDEVTDLVAPQGVAACGLPEVQAGTEVLIFSADTTSPFETSSSAGSAVLTDDLRNRLRTQFGLGQPPVPEVVEVAPGPATLERVLESRPVSYADGFIPGLLLAGAGVLLLALAKVMSRVRAARP